MARIIFAEAEELTVEVTNHRGLELCRAGLTRDDVIGPGIARYRRDHLRGEGGTSGQILLDWLQALRHQREDESAQGGSLGPKSVSWLVEGINHCAALTDAMASLDDPEISDPPFRAAMRYLMEADEPLARGIHGLIAEDGFLRQLARYEQRALGQRRKAIEQITGYEISRRFMRQTA